MLFVKIKTKPDTWDVTAFISVSAELGRPLLVPFPQVPESPLDGASGASFGECARAYRALVADTVARVNLVAPAALALAQPTRP